MHFCSCNLHGACGGKDSSQFYFFHPRLVAICTERVEAKLLCVQRRLFQNGLQSARSVWRQSTRFTRFRNPCSLQSARSVWRQRVHQRRAWQARPVAICTERVEAKSSSRTYCSFSVRCNLHGACGGKGSRHSCKWSALCCNLHGACGGKEHVCTINVGDAAVAICTGRVEDLASSPEKNPRKFMQTYCIFIHLGV